MKSSLYFLTAPLLALALTFNSAVAGPGHDHGDETAGAPAGPASPRFEAHSDLFEVVGVLEGHDLSVFIDRYSDNEPILEAEVELESGTTKSVGKFHPDSGSFKFAGESFTAPGSYPMTLTVTAGDEIDILAGNLVVPGDHVEEGHEEEGHEEALLSNWIMIAIGAVLVLLVLVWGVRRMKKQSSTGGYQ
jgi:hypothetical protein